MGGLAREMSACEEGLSSMELIGVACCSFYRIIFKIIGIITLFSDIIWTALSLINVVFK
jgi:hypothetical protein